MQVTIIHNRMATLAQEATEGVRQCNFASSRKSAVMGVTLYHKLTKAVITVHIIYIDYSFTLNFAALIIML